jgi:hypothetical protein
MKKLIAMVLTLVLVPMLFAGAVSPRTLDGFVREKPAAIEGIEKQIPQPSGRQQILFVQDPGVPDLGIPAYPDPWWSAVLDSVVGSSAYTMWGPTTGGASEDGPDLATMQGYELVIWDTYDWWDPSLGPGLTANDQTNLENYISGGGKVWLIGQDILWSGTPLAFMTTNFDLASAVQDYAPGDGEIPYPVQGIDELDGWIFSFLVDWGSDIFADDLTPTANAHQIINDVNNPAYFPAIIREDYTTSFWTVDGRNPDPWESWQWVVYYMLDAFGVLGIAENNNTVPQDFGFSATTISRGSVSIHFALPAATTVELSIYDALGRVRETVISEKFSAGSHNVNTHLTLPSGVYFYKMDTGVGITATEKLVLVD